MFLQVRRWQGFPLTHIANLNLPFFQLKAIPPKPLDSKESPKSVSKREYWGKYNSVTSLSVCSVIRDRICHTHSLGLSQVPTITGAFCFPRDIPQFPTIVEQILFDPPFSSHPTWCGLSLNQHPSYSDSSSCTLAESLTCKYIFFLKWQFGTEIIGVSFYVNYPAFALPNLHGEQPSIAFSLGGIVCLLQPHKLQMETNSGGFFCVNMKNNKAWRKWSVWGC